MGADDVMSHGGLTDNNKVFSADLFHSYVVREICAIHVYTSGYYPQGNAINEAAHKAVDKCIDTALMDSTCTLEEAIASAQAVHNATPHVSTGYSPYAAMFGFEPIMPGWQSKRRDTQVTRAHTLKEARERRQVQELLLKEERTLSAETIRQDDWVVHPLSQYELSIQADMLKSSRKYCGRWSLPCKVLEVKDRVAIVSPLGDPLRVRQVPIAQLKLLEKEVPRSLEPLLVEQITKEMPAIDRRVRQAKYDGPRKTLDDVIRMAKRKRTSRNEHQDDTMEESP